MASSIKFGLSALSMAIMLAACGGDSGGGSLIGNPTGPNNPGTGDPDAPPVLPQEPRLGTGTGSGFQSGQINVTNANLAAGGRTGLEVNIVDINRNSALITGEETTILFTSNCASQVPPRAQFTLGADAVSEVSTRSGIAKITYEALGCVGNDTVTAILTNGARATTNITVAPPVLNSIVFDRVGMSAISIAGYGTTQRPDTTQVAFAVLDNTGNPVEGVPVEFSLSSQLGGVKLSTATAETDTAGIAKTFVNAGIVNTEVRVVAKAQGIPGSTISDPIAINTGLPDQDSFSIAVSTFNPNAGNINNTEVDVTVNAADAYNNPVRDGTTINFVASGGSIDNSCTTVDGRCSVKWRSSDPRPENYIARILARSVGEESFVDSNSNGLFDPGERIEHLSDAWLDADHDGIYDGFNTRETNVRNGYVDRHQWQSSGGYYERYFDYGQTGEFTPVDAGYQGLACSPEADTTGLCDRKLVETRATASIIMASNDIGIERQCFAGEDHIDPCPDFYNVRTDGPLTVCYDFYGQVSDSEGYIPDYDHTPPVGSAVNITADNGKLSGRTSYKVANQFALGRRTAGTCVTVSQDDEPSAGTLEASIDVDGLIISSPSIGIAD